MWATTVLCGTTTGESARSDGVRESSSTKDGTHLADGPDRKRRRTRFRTSGWSTPRRYVDGSSARRRLYYCYLIALCVIFAAILVASAADIFVVLPELPIEFWVIAAMAVLTPLFTQRPPDQRELISSSIIFTFAITYAWGHGLGRLTQVLAILVASVLVRHGPWSVVFDIGRYGLALTAAALIAALGGRALPTSSDVSHLGFVLLAVAAWYVVFRLATATEAWLREGGTWLRAIGTGAGPEALNAGALLLLSPMLIATMNANAWLIPLVLVPLYAVNTLNRLWHEQETRYLRDPLTGLGNMATMARETEQLTKLLVSDQERRGRGAPGVAALLVADISHFRLINDALGYEVGDRDPHRRRSIPRKQDQFQHRGRAPEGRRVRSTAE